MDLNSRDSARSDSLDRNPPSRVVSRWRFPGKHWQFCFVLVGAISLGCCPALAYADLVVPNTYAQSEAPAGMFTVIATNARTYQAIIHEDQLSGIVGHDINSMSYRLNGVLSSGFPFVETHWSNYEIRLGTSVSPEEASTTFDDNFINGSSVVRSGSLTVPTFAWPAGTSSPAPWGFEITFDQSFQYEGGHLAFLIRHSGSDNQNPANRLVDSTSDSSPGVGFDFTAISALGQSATSGNQIGAVPITRFSTTPTAVPEPSAFAALICATVVGSLIAIRARFGRQHDDADAASAKLVQEANGH